MQLGELRKLKISHAPNGSKGYSNPCSIDRKSDVLPSRYIARRCRLVMLRMNDVNTPLTVKTTNMCMQLSARKGQAWGDFLMNNKWKDNIVRFTSMIISVTELDLYVSQIIQHVRRPRRA